jgi:DNA ligase-associated metallophosphoesterase
MREGCAPHEAGLGALTLRLDLSGAIYLPEERTLLVADLHLEKGASFARRGLMLPPYDSAATLALLHAAIRRHAPRRIVALGDSFHRKDSAALLDAETRAALLGLMTGHEWIWISGNHDPDAPAGLPGETLPEMMLGGVALRHEPSCGASTPEMAGHLHPAAKIRVRGRSLRRRCFALSESRCVMPAMGAYAGGLNLCDAAFAPLFGSGVSPRVIGDGRIFAIDRRMLLPD